MKPRVFNLSTPERNCLLDITDQVARAVGDSGLEDGAVMVYIPHTTAGVTVNEGADPAVKADILARLEKLVPENAGYRHAEGNSDAHIKSTIVGSSCLVPVESGKLALGTWQKIFFCEFDGPRNRRFSVIPLS